MPTIDVKAANPMGLKQHFDNIRDVEIDIEEILTALQDWESRSTLTAKKILTTLAAFLAVAHFIGFDYQKLSVIGLSNPDNPVRVGDALLAILVYTAISFFWYRRIDLKHRAWKTSLVEKKIGDIEGSIAKIQNQIKRHDSIDFSKVDLVYNAVSGQTKLASKSHSLTTYYFYRDEFKPVEWRKLLFERVEFCAIYFLALYGVVGIVCHFEGC